MSVGGRKYLKKAEWSRISMTYYWEVKKCINRQVTLGLAISRSLASLTRVVFVGEWKLKSVWWAFLQGHYLTILPSKNACLSFVPKPYLNSLSFLTLSFTDLLVYSLCLSVSNFLSLSSFPFSLTTSFWGQHIHLADFCTPSPSTVPGI